MGKQNALNRRGTSRKISACQTELTLTHSTLPLHEEVASQPRNPKADLIITLIYIHILPFSSACDHYLKSIKSYFGLKDIRDHSIKKNIGHFLPVRNWRNYSKATFISGYRHYFQRVLGFSWM